MSQDRLKEDPDLTQLKSIKVFLPAALHEELSQRLSLKNHWDVTFGEIIPPSHKVEIILKLSRMSKTHQTIPQLSLLSCSHHYPEQRQGAAEQLTLVLWFCGVRGTPGCAVMSTSAERATVSTCCLQLLFVFNLSSGKQTPNILELPYWDYNTEENTFYVSSFPLPECAAPAQEHDCFLLTWMVEADNIREKIKAQFSLFQEVIGITKSVSLCSDETPVAVH